MLRSALHRLFLSILILLATAGCTMVEPAHTDATTVARSSGLLVDSDCYVACWEGIKLGPTSEEELIAHGFTRSDMAADDYSLYVRSDAAALLSPDQDLVAVEIFGPITLTLGEVIQRLGVPEYFSQSLEITSETATNYGVVQFFYPSFGLWFYSDSRGGIRIGSNTSNERLCISPSNFVVRAIIVQPGSLEELLQRINFPRNLDTLDGYLREIERWEGFSCD